jgi:phospholipase/lecithinase/hemolysin
MSMKIKNAGLLSFLVGLLLIVHTTVFAHQAYSKLVVFGDSLSDPGNAFILTGQFSVRPFSLIPEAPYAIGGMHFSNGKTWAEVLAKALHLPSGPAFRNPLWFSNYAIGGARARSSGSGADLTDQINIYLGQHNNVADPNALYVIMIGGNDIRDAIVAYPSDPNSSNEIIAEALTSLGNNLQTLVADGARNFLIGNAPNLALVPAVLQQGLPAQMLAGGLSIAYNGGVDGIVNTLSAAPYLHVAKLDVFNLLESLVNAPQQIGLTDVIDTCITPGVIVHAICRDQDDYLFWDGIHPTHTVHEFLAYQAYQLVH